MDDYKIEEISSESAAALIKRFTSGPENRAARRSLVLPGGLEIVGEFSLVARDVASGDVAWEHAEKNLITDFGRRNWMEARWHQAMIAFAPSLETPQFNRYSLPSDSTQTFSSAALTPGVTLATHTKTFSTTFGTPGTNRTLGCIILGRFTGSTQYANMGIDQILAFALLTPPKIQTTIQTLEVTYRVSMNPIS